MHATSHARAAARDAKRQKGREDEKKRIKTNEKKKENTIMDMRCPFVDLRFFRQLSAIRQQGFAPLSSIPLWMVGQPQLMNRDNTAAYIDNKPQLQAAATKCSGIRDRPADSRQVYIIFCFEKKAPPIFVGYVNVIRKRNCSYKIHRVIKQNKQWLRIPRRQVGIEKKMRRGFFLTKML